MTTQIQFPLRIREEVCVWRRRVALRWCFIVAQCFRQWSLRLNTSLHVTHRHTFGVRLMFMIRRLCRALFKWRRKLLMSFEAYAQSGHRKRITMSPTRSPTLPINTIVETSPTSPHFSGIHCPLLQHCTPSVHPMYARNDWDATCRL